MIALALMLDTFAESEGQQSIDIKFDEIEKAVAKRYESALEITRNVSKTTEAVEGWNPDTKGKEHGQIVISASAPFELDSKYLGEITVVGKSDPLIFAVDVVANSLWRHLGRLPPNALLNNATSVVGWEAESLVWGKDALQKRIR